MSSARLGPTGLVEQCPATRVKRGGTPQSRSPKSALSVPTEAPVRMLDYHHVTPALRYVIVSPIWPTFKCCICLYVLIMVLWSHTTPWPLRGYIHIKPVLIFTNSVPQQGYGKTAANDLTCTQCAAGTYQDKFSYTLCKQCAAGSYQPNKGGNTCYTCPDASAYTQTSNICCAGVCSKAMDTIPQPDFMQRVDPYWIQDPRKLPWYVIPTEEYQTAIVDGNTVDSSKNDTIGGTSWPSVFPTASTNASAVQGVTKTVVRSSEATYHTGNAAAYVVGAAVTLFSFTYSLV